jgi:hypothetical protein
MRSREIYNEGTDNLLRKVDLVDGTFPRDDWWRSSFHLLLINKVILPSVMIDSKGSFMVSPWVGTKY